MAGHVARQFYRLEKVHSLIYGRWQAAKMAANQSPDTRIGSKRHLMNYLG